MKNNNDEASRLKQIYSMCLRHSILLKDALDELQTMRPFSAEQLESNDKQLFRTLDQFAYRYTRLQYEIDARLIPETLKALGEEISTMAAIDRFNRLEQLGWLPSTDEWLNIREIRNEFTHDYPELAEDHVQKLEAALNSAQRLREIFDHFSDKLEERGFIL